MPMRTLKSKNVLITGGAGFIGSHLAEGVLVAGASKVAIVDNLFVGKLKNLENISKDIIFYQEDAADLTAMEAIIRKEKIQVVYNMATMALIYSFFNPHTAYMVNVRLADVLCHLLRNNEYETLIHASSSEAYGTALYTPMDENHPLNPTTPYAAGKAAADLLVKSFCNMYNDFDAAIIRPFNNYGPRQNMDGPLAGIIPLTVRLIQGGGKPVIEGDGNQTRDYIYVSDTVKGFIAAYERSLKGEIINLGSGIEIKINDILNAICAYMGCKGEYERRPERTADVRRLCASAEKAGRLLGLTEYVPFDEGIKKTLDWYKNSLPKGNYSA